MAFLAPLAVPLAIAGTVLSVGGALFQGQAQKQAYEYQAEVAKRNQQLQLLNAQQALDRSRNEAITVSEQNRALYGQQVAAQSASGLKLGGRSQILTRKSARELGRRDVLNVIHAGEVEAYNYKVAAQDSGSQAGFLKQSGNNAMLASFLGAGSALVGGLQSSAFQVPTTPNLTAVKPYQPRYLGGR